jgi:hypothetical protein
MDCKSLLCKYNINNHEEYNMQEKMLNDEDAGNIRKCLTRGQACQDIKVNYKNWWMNATLLETDKKIIKLFAHDIVAGFLNLGQIHGWFEGCYDSVAIGFVRYTMEKFLHKNKNASNIIVKAVESFSGPNHWSKTSQVFFHSRISGWKHHAIGRIIGYVGKKYKKKKPFFEVLMDSANINPFFVSIYNTESELEQKSNKILTVEDQEKYQVKDVYFDPNHTDAKRYLEKHYNELDNNSIHFLTALIYLEDLRIKDQTVGNCWMKKSMRALLCLLFLETVIENNISPELAWIKAKIMYTEWQISVVPMIKRLIYLTSVSIEAKQTAQDYLSQKRIYLEQSLSTLNTEMETLKANYSTSKERQRSRPPSQKTKKSQPKTKKSSQKTKKSSQKTKKSSQKTKRSSQKTKKSQPKKSQPRSQKAKRTSRKK